MGSATALRQRARALTSEAWSLVASGRTVSALQVGSLPEEVDKQGKKAGYQNFQLGNTLVVQWLRNHASTAGGMGSVPGPGTKIPHATQPGQKKPLSAILAVWHLNLMGERGEGRWGEYWLWGNFSPTWQEASRDTYKLGLMVPKLGEIFQFYYLPNDLGKSCHQGCVKAKWENVGESPLWR